MTPVDPGTVPLTALPKVGPATARKLADAGIRTLADLLALRPLRYEDHRTVTPIRLLQDGEFGIVEGISLGGRVLFGKRRRFVARVRDNTGLLTCMFFRFKQAHLKDAFANGKKVRVAGKVSLKRGAQMVHPQVQRVGAVAGELTPVYPEVAGVGAATLRGLITAGLEAYGDRLLEPLPDSVREQHGLPHINEAVRGIHAPDEQVDRELIGTTADPAWRRAAFAALLSFRLALAQRRAARQQDAPRVPSVGNDWFAAGLPFQPTAAQARCFDEIAGDLASGFSMARLLQGDVGSGKSAVAFAAVEHVLNAGFQAALMAPTELLARQLHARLSARIGPRGHLVALLTASAPARDAAATRRALADGRIPAVVGTQSLLSDKLQFANLGLVVIDEQHRFGVAQRLALRQKAAEAHLLVMTATPIPRTVALTAYGDLELSVIDERPPGQSPITTSLHRLQHREAVFARVAQAVEQGAQAFVILPRVEDGVDESLSDAVSTHEWLSQGPLAGHPVGLVHGRMSAADKAHALDEFAKGRTRVLVSTTVVEVGVDVPHATLMIIEHAERYGLSQLHQMRGRVARGTAPGRCYLLVADTITDEARDRLKVMTETDDGFAVAEADFAQRGPGAVLGTQQSGPGAALAAYAADARLLAAAVRTAEELAPLLHEHPPLAAEVKRWVRRIEAVDAG